MTKKNNALIFGGSGFLGVHLSNYLLDKNFKIYVFDIKRNPNLSKKVKFIKGNIKNKNEVNKIPKNFDFVFNFAGISDLDEANKNPISTIENNLIGTVNILQSLINSKKLKKFIFASSIYALSNQGGFYSSTKRSCENLIENYSEKYNINFSILRYGSVYGIGSSKSNTIYNLIYQGIKKNIILRDGSGEEIRNYINVNDASKLTYMVLSKRYDNKYINIIGKEKLKVKKVIKTILKKIKVKKVKYLKNIKSKYHYFKNPIDYKIPGGQTLKPVNGINLSKGIDEVINEIKKN